MANPKKICILLNVGTAVRAKGTKLNVRTCFYGNHKLEERLFSRFKRQPLFVVTLQVDATVRLQLLKTMIM